MIIFAKLGWRKLMGASYLILPYDNFLKVGVEEAHDQRTSAPAHQRTSAPAHANYLGSANQQDRYRAQSVGLLYE